jgi:DNA topoisomerase-3
LINRFFFTEKPDAGRELAAYLGKKARTEPQKAANGKSIIIGNDVVSWGIGHLLGLADSDHYFAGRGLPVGKNGKIPWKNVPLPIIPTKFVMIPLEDDEPRRGGGRRGQLDEIGKLMMQANEIWNAGDPDREGQLIFDELRDYFEIKKPIKRIIFSALNDDAFDKAFANVCDNSSPKIANAGFAAYARSISDWLIGINATRAMTLSHSSFGDGTMNLGRVFTPVVAIVARRKKEIDNFVAEPIYTPVIKMPDGTVLTWNKRVGDPDQPGMKDGKIVSQSLAQQIVDNINRGLAGEIIESKSVEKHEQPPLPFSLPSIQAELSKKFGLQVEQITKACQSLYDKKMQTYVGTDCRYLPESMHSEAIQVLDGLRGKFSSFVGKANPSIKYACWDDSKMDGDGGIAAHHAIIPTGLVGKTEGDVEKLVYDAVCRRYLAQFHPEHKYLSLSIVSMFGQDEFKANATVTISPGWKLVENDNDDSDNSNQLTDSNDQRNDNKNKMDNH